MQTTKISAADDGIRLDRWLLQHFPNVRRSEIMRAIRTKLIRVDGKRATANQRIYAGQIIKHPNFADSGHIQNHSTTTHPLQISAYDKIWLQQSILFKDTNIIAINKPPGIATQGGSNQFNHIDKLLPALQLEASQPPKLVHRLDKDTSGVLLLARNKKTAKQLISAFAKQQIRKTYWALLQGTPSSSHDIIKLPISKKRISGQEIMTPDNISGRMAITEYKIIDKLANNLTWVELYPHTGRTHQLRVHMHSIGCPIYGDGKYGGKQAFIPAANLPRKLHLHARTIEITGIYEQKIKITAPLPDHMRQSWDILGLHHDD